MSCSSVRVFLSAEAWFACSDLKYVPSEALARRERFKPRIGRYLFSIAERSGLPWETSERVVAEVLAKKFGSADLSDTELWGDERCCENVHLSAIL